MPYELGPTLLTAERIAARVAELAAAITADYRGKTLFLICVLKGSTIFWADLCRRIELPTITDFCAVHSYGDGTDPAGAILLTQDLSLPIAGQEVLIVEDIVDTGRTLHLLRSHLLTRQPASLRVCVLLDKVERRQVPVPLDYVGFAIPNEFVVGYGLDFAQRYRNLPYVATLKAT